MATIDCPECGEEVFSSVEYCPECRSPVDPSDESPSGIPDDSESNLRFYGPSMLVIPGLLIGTFVDSDGIAIAGYAVALLGFTWGLIQTHQIKRGIDE